MRYLNIWFWDDMLQFQSSVCQQTYRIKQIMWKSNPLASMHQKEYSKHSNIKSSQHLLRLQSKAKHSLLYKVVHDRKVETSKTSRRSKQQQLAIESEIDNKQKTIKILEGKITLLEKKLSHLSQKHMEVCNMLYKQLQKKATSEVSLRKENEELNKMLKQMMDEANKLVSKLYYKGHVRTNSESRVINSSVPEKSKQNVNKFNIYSSNKLSNHKMQERKRSRSRKIKIFFTRSKFKTIFSNNENSDKEDCNTAVRGVKINQTERDYYKSENPNLTNPEGRNRNYKILALLDKCEIKRPIKITESTSM